MPGRTEETEKKESGQQKSSEIWRERDAGTSLDQGRFSWEWFFEVLSKNNLGNINWELSVWVRVAMENFNYWQMGILQVSPLYHGWYWKYIFCPIHLTESSMKLGSVQALMAMDTLHRSSVTCYRALRLSCWMEIVNWWFWVQSIYLE